MPILKANDLPRMARDTDLEGASYEKKKPNFDKIKCRYSHCRDSGVYFRAAYYFFLWMLQYKEADVADESRAVVKEICIILLDAGKNRLETGLPSHMPPSPPPALLETKDRHCTRAMNYNWTDI
jgi:hypothetical protein